MQGPGEKRKLNKYWFAPFIWIPFTALENNPISLLLVLATEGWFLNALSSENGLVRLSALFRVIS